MSTRIKDYEGADYATFWQGKESLNELERSIIKRLIPETGSWLVDLGCGFGRYSDLYVGNYDHVVLVDYSVSLLRQAQAILGPRASYVAANVYRLPFKPEIFDVALMVRVFHHLSAPQRALKEVGRILGGGGVFVLNFSNKRNPAQIARYILGRSRNNPFSLEASEYGYLLFGHHPKYVAELLAQERLAVRASFGAGILDKLVDRMPAKVADLMPKGELLAAMLGHVLLGPIVFWRAERTSRKELMNQSKPYTHVAEILVCPSCQTDLGSQDHNLKCVNCGQVYEVVDGVFDLRIES